MAIKSFAWLLLSGVLSVGAMATAAVAQPAPQLEDLLGQAEADSDVLDLTEVTCRSFSKSDDDDRESLMIFMHGYMTGVSGETTEVQAVQDKGFRFRIRTLILIITG